MNAVTRLFTRTPAPIPTAESILEGHKAVTRKARAEVVQLADSEASEQAHVSAEVAARNRIADLERRIADARADELVDGGTSVDIGDLQTALDDAKRQADALAPRAAVAKRVIERLTDKRRKADATYQALRKNLYVHAHAAAVELLPNAMEQFLAAERAFHEAAIELWSIAGTVNNICHRTDDVQLPEVGKLNVFSLLHQRPKHESIVNMPEPDLKAVAESVMTKSSALLDKLLAE